MFECQRLGCRVKRHIFKTIYFAAIFMLLVLADSLFCNLSLHYAASRTKKNLSFLPNRGTSGARQIPLNSVTEEAEGGYSEDHQRNFNPPINVTAEERIDWFRKVLPEFGIFKSTRVTQQFEGRVRRFFEGECESRFFMTWISPANSFGRRELIAMDSLFTVHPNGCLMILSPSLDSRMGDRILKPFQDRGFRVLAVAPDAPFLLKDTPAESWFDEMKSGRKDPGEIPIAQNLSNLLRLAVLYKYGGVYLDTDFIVLNKFSRLRNTIGAQSVHPVSGNWSRLNNAVLIFDKNHPLVYKFIEEFALTFDGNKWGHNGPYLVSRVVDRVGRRPGYNFTVLPPLAFYPVDWNRIGAYFARPTDSVTSKWVEAKLLQLGKEAYGVHLWNKQSRKLKIEPQSIIAKLILDHCSICENVYTS